MVRKISGQSMRWLLLCGVLGCVLMAAGDWLMIYGDTSFTGHLVWLTEGVAQVAPWRSTMAMALSFPALLCYAAALFGLRHLFHDQPAQRTYCALTSLGMTPWLCLHLFYIMILFLFAWLRGQGEAQLALAAGEALFGQFSWVVLVSQLIMVLPFLYVLFAFLTQRTDFSRWMALNNPLLIYAVLKLSTRLMPDVPARLAFTNGLMSESMLLWFLIYLLALTGHRDRLY